MKEKVQNLLTESAVARWSALILIALTMFFAYFFIDVAAPLQSLLEKAPYNWSPTIFGSLASSEYFLNVFACFLILSGIILDKMGIRFTLMTSAILMVVGGAIKYYALTEAYRMSGLFVSFSSFLPGIPADAKLAFIGFSIFGVGVEMAGITVSKTIVKWFKGKELALAMGLEMAIARLGVFAVFRISPMLAGEGGVTSSVGWGVALLCVGLLSFLMYLFMDIKLDKQLNAGKGVSKENEFKIRDLGKIITNPGFLTIAGLCVLFYSAVFPFQKFATNLLEAKLHIPTAEAAAIFSWFPVGALILTPIIGFFLDRFGKGVTLMLYGSILLIIAHLAFAFLPDALFNKATAIGIIVLLGIAFSLVPASLWPSIPKIVEERYLGSTYGLTFWVQNIGLFVVPLVVGVVLTATNPGVAALKQAGAENIYYDYTVVEIIFAGFGVGALILSLVLRKLDKVKKYGLELPNKA